jgi:type IV fimbrial biogenesis protein FimT
MRKIKHNSGLTLIELLVTLTVLGIMVAIGVPQYQRMTAANRTAGSINALASDLKLARTEAAKRSQVVTICASTPGVDACSGNNNWELGWIVFSDEIGNGNFDPPNDIMVSQNTGLSAGLTLTGDNDFPDPTILQFIPSGELRINNPPDPPDGTFLLCQPGITDANIRNIQARGIIVSNMGRVRAARDDTNPALPDGDDIREDNIGDNFVCP